jgi:hypothetical protein
MEFYTFDAMNLVLADLAGTLGVSSMKRAVLPCNRRRRRRKGSAIR